MPTVAEVLRQVAPRYLEQYQARMPVAQQKVLGLITRCRTGELGTITYHCGHCHAMHYVGRSCGNRHCPQCQDHKTRQWQIAQEQRLLPVPYFLLTFTIPAHLRQFVRSHPKECYEALFRASSETLRVLMADPRHVGAADAGFLGVLHTWGRDLNYHPHVHYVVPGGGLTADRKRWVVSKAGFLIPVKAASKIYRAKFREEMERCGLLSQIDRGVWSKAWVVHSQAAGDGRAAVRYLSRYVYKVAISNQRIVSYTDTPDGQGRVTFKYQRKSGDKTYQHMTVSGFEFTRRFLQHVLPPRFRKVRYYGFMTQARQDQFESVKWLVSLALGMLYYLTSQPPAKPKPVVCCPNCGGPLQFVYTSFKPLRDLIPTIRPPPQTPEPTAPKLALSGPERLAQIAEFEALFLPSCLQAALHPERAGQVTTTKVPAASSASDR